MIKPYTHHWFWIRPLSYTVIFPNPYSKGIFLTCLKYVDGYVSLINTWVIFHECDSN